VIAVIRAPGFGLLHFMTMDPTPQLMGQPAECAQCIFCSSQVRIGAILWFYIKVEKLQIHCSLDALGPVNGRLAGGRWSEQDGIFHHHQGFVFSAKSERKEQRNYELIC